MLALPATREGPQAMVPFTLMAMSACFIVKGNGAMYNEAVISRRFHLRGSILGIRYLEGGPGAQNTMLSSFHFFPLKKNEQRLDYIPGRDIAQPSDLEGLGCPCVPLGASHVSSGASRPRRGKERDEACKMLLALGTNWSTSVLLGGGTLCALHVLSHGRCPRCLLTFPTHSREHCLSPRMLSKHFNYLVWAPPPSFQ